MKTLNPKTIFAVVAILLTASFAKAQTPVHCCTIIEVTDGYYSDKVWMITEPGTTDGFDNGWDGYKFLSSATYIPQIFDNTADGKFQVSSFPTIENNSFAFMPGSSAEYTLKFTHYDVSFFYKGLYLVDLQSGDTVNVYANLSTYKFAASKTDMVDRFKFITKLPVKPVVVVPPVVEPPVVEPPVVVPPVVEEPVVVVPPVVEEPIVVDPEIDPDGIDVIGNNDKKDKNNKAKDVKVKAYKKTLTIINKNKVQANLKIIDARNGKLFKQITVAAKSTKVVETKAKAGFYIVQAVVEADVTSTTVLLQ
jgi:hypothetical protein